MPDSAPSRRDNFSSRNDSPNKEPCKKHRYESKKNLSKFEEAVQKLDVESVSILFDGACRGNGRQLEKPVEYSFGVYVSSSERYKSPLCSSQVKVAAVATNGVAELDGAIEAVTLSLKIHDVKQIKFFNFKGDATYIISMVMQGNLLSYEKGGRALNNAKWVQLKVLVEELALRGVSTTWTWIPRHQNKEADELANAALDKRAPRDDIRSNVQSCEISTSRIIEAIHSLCNFRRRTLRFIPQGSLLLLWTSLVDNLSRQWRAPISRLLFWLLPALVSLHLQGGIRGPKDFKHLRSHMVLLHNKEYLSQCIADLSEPLVYAQSYGPSASERKFVETLCARGLHDKCVALNDISIAPNTDHLKSAMDRLFPEATLPDVIPVSNVILSECNVSFAQVHRATRKLGRGKSPGLCGWTKELMSPILSSATPSVQQTIADIFTAIVSNSMMEEEDNLFNTAVDLPFYYKEKEKLRPINLLSSLRKIAWKIGLEDKIQADPCVKASGQCAFLPGSSQTAAHSIVALINEGYTVVALDSANAYNTGSRKTARNHVVKYQHLYSRVIPLFNLTYCHAGVAKIFNNDGTVFHTTLVTNGSSQGCTSAGWEFTITTAATLKGWKNSIAQVDDTYVYDMSPTKAIEDAVNLTRQLKVDCGLENNPKKIQIFSPSFIDRSKLPPEFGVAKICGSPHVAGIASFLGTFTIVNPTASSNTQLDTIVRKALEDIRSRVIRKIEKIVKFDAPKQCKFQILIAVSRHLQYYARTIQPQYSDVFFKEMDECFLDAAYKIIGTEDRTTQVHINTPFMHGGFGILPYALLSNLMFYKSQIDAAPFFASRNIHQPITPDRRLDVSILYQWKRLSPRQIASSTTSISWISIWPNNTITRLSDIEFDFIARLQLNCLDPKPYLCPLTNLQLADLGRADYTNHVLSCSHCAACLFNMRHEQVNNMLHRTLKFHSVYSTLNPKDLPRPNNSRGGPDLVIYNNDITAVDVSICLPHENFNSIQCRHNFKMRNYKEFSEKTTFKILPWVMSAYGSLSPQCIEAAKTLAHQIGSSSLFHDLINNSIFALFRGQLQGIATLHARALKFGPNLELLSDSLPSNQAGNIVQSPTNDQKQPTSKENYQKKGGSRQGSPQSS